MFPYLYGLARHLVRFHFSSIFLFAFYESSQLFTVVFIIGAHEIMLEIGPKKTCRRCRGTLSSFINPHPQMTGGLV